MNAEVYVALQNIYDIPLINEKLYRQGSLDNKDNKLCEDVRHTLDKLVHDTLNGGIHITNYIGDNVPDIILPSSKNSKKYLGFEHFSIGSHYYKTKNSKLNNKVEAIYSKRVKILKNSKEEYRETDWFDMDAIIKADKYNDTFLDIRDVLIDTYKKHYCKINRYIEVLKEKDAYASKDNIWFIIDCVDTMAINLEDNKETPVILDYNVLREIKNIGYVGGIIYIGMCSVFILSSKFLNSLIDANHRQYIKYDIPNKWKLIMYKENDITYYRIAYDIQKLGYIIKSDKIKVKKPYQLINASKLIRMYY